MALTPLDIHNKEFPTKIRGYDQDEVNEFLDQIIRDYELVIRENKELTSNLDLVNKKLVNYEEMQDSLNKSILVAQDAADRLKVNTDKEIEVMKLEAQNYVDQAKQEADAYSNDIRKEADNYSNDVRKESDQYASKVHQEADDNADKLLEEAVMKARKIEDETENLRKQSRVFRQRLQLLIESQLELLTKEEWDNLLVGQRIEYPDTQTIAEVERELEEKEVIDDEIDSAEELANEETENGEEVAFSDEDHYNNNDSEDEAEDNDEEGNMPAVELPETE